MNIPLNIDWQQILLHLLNFAILAGGLYFLLYKPVKAFMAKREAFYQDQADQAEKTAKEAETLKAQAQAKLDAAAEDAQKLRQEAQQDAQAEIQRQKVEAQAQAEKILATAHALAESDRKRILEDAQHQVKDLAAAAAEKLAFTQDGAALDQFLKLAEKEAQDEQS